MNTQLDKLILMYKGEIIMYCKRGRQELEKEANFCNECGKQI